jgi:hypothetical protein
MIESARRHGPFDPRFRAFGAEGPEALTNGHRRSNGDAKRLEARRLEKARSKAAGWAALAAGWAALQAWEEEGGVTQ